MYTANCQMVVLVLFQISISKFRNIADASWIKISIMAMIEGDFEGRNMNLIASSKTAQFEFGKFWKIISDYYWKLFFSFKDPYTGSPIWWPIRITYLARPKCLIWFHFIDFITYSEMKPFFEKLICLTVLLELTSGPI